MTGEVTKELGNYYITIKKKLIKIWMPSQRKYKMMLKKQNKTCILMLKPILKSQRFKFPLQFKNLKTNLNHKFLQELRHKIKKLQHSQRKNDDLLK